MTSQTLLSREELLELAALDAFGLLDEYEAAIFSRSFHHAPAAVQDEVRQLQAEIAADPSLLPAVDPDWNPLGWSKDGRWLYLFQRGKAPLPVVRLDFETGSSELLWELMPAESAGLIDIGPVEISSDGDAYVYSYRRHLSTLNLATGF